MKDAARERRSRHLRDRQEQPLQDRRGDARRPRQDGLLADPEIGRRLFLRRVRCARARWWRRAPTCRSIWAPCRTRCAPWSPPSAPTCTTATCSSTTIPISAAATCPTSTWCGPPSTTAACSATPACARTGPMSARPRPAATAPSPRSTARACACRRCGSSAAASLNVDLEKVILANVRTPDERKGDLGAQLAATLRATERLKALARALRRRAAHRLHGRGDGLFRAADARHARRPSRRRGLLSRTSATATASPTTPDGEDAPFWIRMRVKKTGDRLVVDFAGTDPQVKGPINAPLSVTASGVFCGLKMAVDPNSLIPPNSGCWRTIEVKAPKGSVVNAEFPAPVVYANHEISHRVADMVMGALASFWPDQVMACSQGTSAILTLGGVDPRSRPPLRLLRDHQGRLRRAPHQGRHQRRRQRHLQHHEHAGRGAGDGLPRARRALRDQPGLRRRRALPRRLRRAAHVAHARRRRCHGLRCAWSA